MKSLFPSLFWAGLASRQAWVALAIACAAPAAVALDLTEGIAVCDNVGVSSNSVPSRYVAASGTLELPLVFAPGLGWYRIALQVAPGTNFGFQITQLEPSCQKQAAPAAYFPLTRTLLVPSLEITDADGLVSRYDLLLALQSDTGQFVPSEIRPAEAVGAVAAIQAPRQAAAPAMVEAVLLDQAVGLYPAGSIVPLTRIAGTHIGNVDAGCNARHLHGSPATFDGAGPYTDPQPSACGFGKLVSVQADSIDPGVINASVPSGTDYCGSNITSAFFARLKLMAARLAALPDSERGVFDGTVFLARNGTNMDFVTGILKDPVGNPVCPTGKCSGVGHTSTFTLCGQCMISHVDNDIEFGFVARTMGVPWSVQLAGGHTWDLVQRAALDPLASQMGYRVGNDLAAVLASNSAATDSQMCAAVTAARLMTGSLHTTVATRTSTSVFSSEMTEFGKDSCRPCPYGCPEGTIVKDFSTQTWKLDGGMSAVYTPP